MLNKSQKAAKFSNKALESDKVEAASFCHGQRPKPLPSFIYGQHSFLCQITAISQGVESVGRWLKTHQANGARCPALAPLESPVLPRSNPFSGPSRWLLDFYPLFPHTRAPKQEPM